MLKSLAALALVTATNWFSSIFPVDCRRKHSSEPQRPVSTCTRKPFQVSFRRKKGRGTTALSHTTDILSSIPLVPSGIRVKSSLPIAFWAVEKLAWALEVSWRSPLEGATVWSASATSCASSGGVLVEVASHKPC